MLDSSKPRRQLGLFDATMIVMGGIVGAGIFANPSEVAHRVHTPFLILGVWVLGGLLAMCGAFIWRSWHAPAGAVVVNMSICGKHIILLCIRVRVGTASSYADWRHGRSRGDFRLVLSRAHWRRLEPKRHRSRSAADIDGHQLFWRPRRQQRAERSNAAENCRHRGVVTIGFAVGGHALEESRPLIEKPLSFDLLKSIGAAMVPIALRTADGRRRRLSRLKYEIRAAICRADCC